MLLLLLSIGAFAQTTQNKALFLHINGAIGPATQDYISRGIAKANQQNYQLVILQIDTPGGLSKSMRIIIKDMLQSSVPIVSYVAPSGARAASAGTFILYASQIAAMAPGTNLGAATPVNMMEPSTPSQDKTKSKKNDKGTAAKPSSALQAKATNDAVAYLQSLAELHQRNAQWAEKAVREATSISAKEALDIGVINVIATNLVDLLKQINGDTVNVQGKNVTINTDNVQIDSFKPNWRTKLLIIITDPSIAYILLMLGIYGLFFEFANPGTIVPGVVGAIALLLAFYGLQMLPVNYVGLALIALGIIFFTAEVFMPSFGALGLGGIVAFVSGSVLLFDNNGGDYAVPWLLIITMTLINLLFFFVIILLALRSRRKAVVIGHESMVGAEGVALENIVEKGLIRIQGETWTAFCEHPIEKGDKIKIVSVDGIKLKIVKGDG